MAHGSAFASVRGHRADSELAIGIEFTLRTMTLDSFLSLDSHTLIVHSLTFLSVFTPLPRDRRPFLGEKKCPTGDFKSKDVFSFSYFFKVSLFISVFENHKSCGNLQRESTTIRSMQIVGRECSIVSRRLLASTCPVIR